MNDFSFSKKSLDEIAKNLEKKTSCTFQFINIDTKKEFSGNYDSISVEGIFTDLLKEYNISLFISDDGKQFKVISLGRKKPDGGNNEKELTINDKENESTSNEIDYPSEKKVSDDSLDKSPYQLRMRQAEAIEQESANSDLPDPLTGSNKIELMKLHQDQVNAIKKN